MSSSSVVAYFAVKPIDVLLGEEEVIVIERLEVVLQELLRDRVVELLATVVPLLEQSAHRDLNLPGSGSSAARTTRAHGEGR